MAASARTFLIALISLLFTGEGNASDWFFLPSPKFMEHEVSFPISGSKSTVLAPARMCESGIEFATVGAWAAAKLDEDKMRRVTAHFGAEMLRHTKVVWSRNSKGVIEYAVLRADKFPVCVTVFAPEFLKQFEDVFGPKVTLVMPNRQTIFVFPAVAVDFSEHSPMILEAWRSPAAKVSLEVFELGTQGLRAIGRIEEP